MEDVISQLRGCLLSVKGQCDLRQISRDFKMLIGSDIPYAKFGYSSLEDFILDIPSLKTSRYNGQLYVDAAPSEKSLHIVNMINKQKTAVKKNFKRQTIVKRNLNRANSNSSYNNSEKWKPNYIKKSFQSSSRPAAVAHNQFVNIYSTPQKKPQVSNRLVINKPESPSRFLADKSRFDPKKNNTNLIDTPKKNINYDEKVEASFEKHRRKSVEELYAEQVKTDSKKPDLSINVRSNGTHSVKKAPDTVINKIKSDMIQSKESSDDVLAKVKLRLTKTMETVETLPGDQNYDKIFDPKLIVGKENMGKEKLNLSDVITRQESNLALKNAQVNQSRKFDNTASPTKIQPKQEIFDNFLPGKKSPTSSHDYYMDLNNFCSSQGLEEPCLKIISRKSRKTFVHDCSIKIGTQTFSSYPADFFDEELVKNHVAKKALDGLMIKSKRKQSLLISNDEDIKERIPSIVKSHANGVWKWQLEADYTEKFKEQLPNNWVEIIDRVPTIEIASYLDNLILRHCKPGEGFQKGTASSTPLASNVSVPSNMVTFTDDQMLLAEVTCVAAAGEIWCRQIDSAITDQFNELCLNIEEYYSRYHEREKVTKVEIGGYYVAINDGVWTRVRVFEINKDDISCFCIDYGDEWVVSRQAIYQLKRNFATLEAQAFVCRLIGVEELYVLALGCDYLSTLVGRTVQVQHIAITSEDESGDASPTDPIFPAVLFDCEANTVINEQLIYKIDAQFIQPKLKRNLPMEVHVMNAEKDGLVYVTLHTSGYEHLMQILKDIESGIDNKILKLSKEEITFSNSVDKLYFIKSKKDSSWYRAKIIDWKSDTKSKLFLVDVGKTIVINLSEHSIYPLDQLGDVAHKLSHQAVKVRMDFNGNIPSDFVERILNLMPSDCPVLLKYDKEDNDKIPLVEFFKRSETDDVLFSVNAALVMAKEFKKPKPNGTTLPTPVQTAPNKIQKLISLNQFDQLKRDNVPSSGSLPSPIFPNIGDFMDVTVPIAVNPYNFMVQPYNTRELLFELMSLLQEKYKNCVNSCLRLEDVSPGQIYASKYEDGNWYRTSVIKVIHAGSISVFNCDFGNYANVTVRELFPLDAEFSKLPYQAIKAKMAGIEPKNKKWSVDDCNTFRELVCNKSFVSVMVSKDVDDLYQYDTVLSLKLIDTSTDNDIYIDQVLIDKEIAIRK